MTKASFGAIPGKVSLVTRAVKVHTDQQFAEYVYREKQFLKYNENGYLNYLRVGFSTTKQSHCGNSELLEGMTRLLICLGHIKEHYGNTSME